MKKNADVDLEVIVEAKDESKMSIEWYDAATDEKLDNDGKKILKLEGVTEKGVDYICRINDGYGSSESVLFHVRIDNNLVVYPEGENLGSTEKNVYVSPKSDTELSVYASANDMDGITYTWYKDDEIVEGS